MKVKTLAWLAALGLTFSSLTVWSVSRRRPAPVPIAAPVAPEQAAPAQPAIAVGALGTGSGTGSFAAAGTLAVEGRLGHATLDATRDNETFLLVEARAGGAPAAQASRLDLVIVIDHSGSMKGRRLANALDAARGMVRRLRDGDRLSVVTYNQTSEVRVPPTSVDASSRERIAASLGAITAQGDTCISCGIETAMDQLRGSAGGVARVLLLSDGEPTTGVKDVDGFRRLATRVRESGASISAVGVDVEYNERVMSALALESNGRHTFVQDAGSLERVFDQELESLQQSLVKNAEVVLDFAPGVEAEQVYDRAFRRDGSRVIVPLGGFSAAEEKTLLVRLRVAAGAVGERAVADVRVVYDDLPRGAGARGEHHGTLRARFTADPSEVTRELDPIVSARLLRSQTAYTLTRANQLYNSGRADEARRALGGRLDDLRKERESAERAPAAARPRLLAEIEQQQATLGAAKSGFDAPAPVAGAPARGARFRKGQAQVRANAAKADAYAY